MKKTFVWICSSVAILLCTLFSFGIVFAENKVKASGGIYIEDGANVNITGGIINNNEKAIVINGGDHIIENVMISGSTNGAIHLAGGTNC